MKNIIELFLSKTREYKENIAFAEPDKGNFDDTYGISENGYIYYTYQNLQDMTIKTAGYLKSKGYGRGTNVALLAENCSYWPVVYFATLYIGGTIVPLDTQLNEKDNIHYLRHSESDVLFTSSNIYENMNLDLASNLNISEVILSDTSPYKGPDSLCDILKYSKTRDEDQPITEKIKASDTAAILYTSGTTGSPKGVCLSHGNLLHQANTIPGAIKYNSEDGFLGILPLFHSFPATACMLASMIKGCKLVFPKTLKATRLVEVMKEQSVTVMIGVPALFESLRKAITKKISNSSAFLKAAFITGKGITKTLNLMGANAGKTIFSSIRSKAGLGNMRIMVSGGAPLMDETANFYQLLGIEFINGYGLSETAPVLTVNCGGPVSSVGKPLEEVQIRITGSNSEGVGLVEACGPNIMKGYYKNNKATKEIMSGKWLKTGDLGYIDSNGYLFLKGRNKNLIVTSAGKNIYPEDIEEKLLKSSFISECMVYGREKSSNDRGQIVEALIYPDYDAVDEFTERKNIEETADTLHDLLKNEIKKCTRELPAYKKIKSFRIQQEEFQKTTTRKIKRYLYTSQE
ncbi:MAG: AMP-dependent synthetase/ligase [Elusimicrobiota bacterium]